MTKHYRYMVINSQN